MLICYANSSIIQSHPIHYAPLNIWIDRPFNSPRTLSQFRGDLKKIVSREGIALKFRPLERILIDAISGGIQEGFRKREGYFNRIFSNETWEEWTESRTELGRVADLFDDWQKNGIDLAKRLDAKTIRKAIGQARALLKGRSGCVMHMIFETPDRPFTAHTLPLAYTAVSCWPREI